MSKKNKTIILLSILFIFINSGVYIITEINKEQRIQSVLDTHLVKLKTNYELLMHYQKVTADAAYQSTINKKDVIDILKKVKKADKYELDILREKLFDILKDKYKILKSKGVLQYHFVLENNEVFLRMHKPSKYGDSLSHIRYSFEYTNKTHKRISGFEKGKTTHGFRNLYPIFDENNNYLCSLEISFSSDYLQDNLTNISKIHSHFLVNKHIFDVKAWKRDDMILEYTQSSENDDFMMSVMESDYKKEHIVQNIKRLEPIKEQIRENMEKEKEFSLYTLFDDTSLVVSFYPIKNIKDNKTVAWIVSYDNDDFIDMTLKMNLYFQLTIFIIFLILFYFVYIVLNQKEILDMQVKEKTKKLLQSEQKLQLLNESLEMRIVEEVKKNQEKDRILFQQSKMASMGEMIGNIAHQWRQPIAIISMWANNIIVDVDMEEVENENLKKYANKINEQTTHLSQTIDDFRNFFAPNKEKVIFNLNNSIDKTMSLLNASFKTHSIEVIKKIEELEILGLENEFTQAMLNIIKNSKDVLVTLPKESRRLIFINIYLKDSNIIIEIKDNGGGVPENIMDKIFEPYFTTKHKSQGTGIGLYMTETIITKHFNGKILVDNVKYQYDGVTYTGARFIIKLPIK